MLDAHDNGDHVVDGAQTIVDRRPFRDTPPKVRSDRPPARQRFETSWIDLVFALAVGATAIAYLNLSRNTYFSGEDWPLSLRGYSLSDYLQPYNGHLSIVTLATYRVLFKVFGFETYAPWRFVGVVAILSAPVALYCIARVKVGQLIAAVAAGYLLWFPHTVLSAASIGYSVAVTAAIICAYALGRDDTTGDVVVGAALVVGLGSADVALATVAACIVHAACTRAGPRRWIAVLAPAVVWAGWWVRYHDSNSRAPAALRLDASGYVHTTFDGIRNSFDALAFDNHFAGTILMVAFVVHLAWRLRQGLQASVNVLAWTTALIVCWLLLADSRGTLANVNSIQYVLSGSVFILLALIPTKPLKLPELTRSPVAALALVVAGALIVVGNQGPITDAAHTQRQVSLASKRMSAQVNLGQSVVPDNRRLGPNLGNLTAKQFRRAADAYGAPGGAGVNAADKVLIDTTNFQFVREANALPCTRPRPQLGLPAVGRVRISTGSAPTQVTVRRFGNIPIPIGSVPARTTVTVQLAGPTRRPWTVIAPGACVAAVRRTR